MCSSLIDPSFALLPAVRGGGDGIATAQRSPLAPDVPTMGEAGLPGYVEESWYGIWAPKGTPAEIRAAHRRADARDHGRSGNRPAAEEPGARVPVTESVDETKRFIASEIVRARELLRSVKFEPS